LKKKTPGGWTTIFHLKGKDWLQSKIAIRLSISWVLNNPYIDLEFFSKK